MRRGHLEMAQARGAIGVPRVTPPHVLADLHRYGARTDWPQCRSVQLSVLEEPDGMDASLDMDASRIERAQQVLVLSELNHLLVWRDFGSEYFSSNPDCEEKSLQSGLHRFYIR